MAAPRPSPVASSGYRSPYHSQSKKKRCSAASRFLLNGNMLVGVWRDSLIVLLGPDDGDNPLKEPHAKESVNTGPAMKGLVLAEPERVEDNEQLEGWIERAVTLVNTLPVG
jgi:hypothetical protein